MSNTPNTNYLHLRTNTFILDSDIMILVNSLCSKVFLGHKKSDAKKFYAIKVLKKADMVNKNMVNEGKFFYTANFHVFIVQIHL